MSNDFLPSKWWSSLPDNSVQCSLCHHGCTIPLGQRGWCGVRVNDNGILRSPNLNAFSSMAIDPIEKKPLARWRPGTQILSLGGIGCNMDCPFCQNSSIAHPTAPVTLTRLFPEDILAIAQQHEVQAVAYTYNEPLLQAEFILHAAPVLTEANVATVLVTNGMVSPQPLEELLPHIAAANVDVKCFDPQKYAAMGGSLKTVQATVERMVRGGVHVELTHLVVPKISDDENAFLEMLEWISQLSPEIPLHITRYHPCYRYNEPQTKRSLLDEFGRLARTKLHHVYLGNV